MQSTNRTYILALDQLRGLALLLVIAYHGLQLFSAQLAHGRGFDAARDWIISLNPILAIVEEGHTGVGAFITLSGFVLSLGVLGERFSVRGFLVARILRIYPMLLVCLLAAAFFSRPKFSHVLLSLLPFEARESLSVPLTAMFWAVRVELQCYIAFVFLMWLGEKQGIRALVSVVVAMIFLRIAVTAVGWSTPRDISYWTFFGRVDQFCIGMIAARLFKGGWRSPVSTANALLAVGGVLVGFNQLGGWPVNASWKIIWPDLEAFLWSGVIVAAANAAPWNQLTGRVLAWIGEISYSSYLVHFSIIFFIIKRNLMLRFTNDSIIDALITTALLAIPLALMVGAAGYYIVERPALRRRPRYVKRNSSVNAAIS